MKTPRGISLPICVYTSTSEIPGLSSLFTDSLFSLQSPSSARDKKKNRGGFIERQRKGVVVGKEEKIPEARKKYPFRAEPSRVGHYREYPQGKNFSCIQKFHTITPAN